MAFLTISAVDILISTISYIEQHNRSSLVKNGFYAPYSFGLIDWSISLLFHAIFSLFSGSDD